MNENGQNVTQNEKNPPNPTKHAAENMCQKILRYKGKTYFLNIQYMISNFTKPVLYNVFVRNL